MQEERLHRLLPRYLLGNLDDDDVARFRDHLQACDECQAEKAFLEEVQARVESQGEGFLEDHPPVDKLVSYLRQDLTDAESLNIRNHLNLCATCATEVRWISGDDVVGRPAGAAVAPIRGSRSWGWAAVAAAIVLAVLLPTLFRQDSGLKTGGLDPQLITPIERDVRQGSVVRWATGETRLTMYFPVDLPTSGFPCEAEVVRADGEIVHVETVDSRDDLDGGLYVFFECTRADCRPGSYAVHIRGSGGEPPETIPFQVVEAE